MRLSATTLLLALSLPALRAECAPVVAVFAIDDTRETGRLSPRQRDDLTDYLSSQLGAGGVFKIIPKAELQAALRAKKAETYSNCYDESCQIAIGQEVAAEKSVATKIVRFGATCIITGLLYDLRRGASDTSGHYKGECSSEALLTGLEAVAQQLRAGTRGPSTAQAPSRPSPKDGAGLLVVNRQTLLRESTEGRAARATLKEDFDIKQAELNRRQEALKALRQRVTGAAAADKARLRREYEHDLKELQDLFTASQEALKASESALVQRLTPGVDSAVADLAGARSARLILEREAAVYLDPCLDVTQGLIAAASPQPCKTAIEPLIAFVDLQRVLEDSDALRRERAALNAKPNKPKAQAQTEDDAAVARFVDGTVRPALARIAEAKGIGVFLDAKHRLHGIPSSDCTRAALGEDNATCEGISVSRIRYVDVDAFFKSSESGKRAQRTLHEAKDRLQQELSDRAEALKRRKGQIPKEQFGRELSALQHDLASKQSELMDLEAKLKQPVLRELLEALQPLPTRDGGDAVIDKVAVAYGAPSLSMTSALTQVAADEGR